MNTVNDLMDELSEEYFVETTFQHIVWFRQDELTRILNGERAAHVIKAPNQRKKLRRDGVLENYYDQGGKKIRLTEKAKTFLLEMIKDE